MTGDHTAQVSDDELMQKTAKRLLPLLIICLVIGTIDRGNIGFAKLGMLSDLGFTEAIFGLGSSLFYLGYVLFEVPSTMASHRYGARIWFARIMVTWSVTTLLLTLASSIPAFYSLRFLLGAAEAGLYPSLIFYLTLWFPAERRPWIMGYLTLGSAFGNGISAILCGSLLELDGVLDLRGWQWIFIVSGLLPLLSTFLVLRYLPDNPNRATFLSQAEKDRLEQILERQRPPSSPGHALSVLFQGKILAFGALYGIFLGSLYGVNYWMPTVFKEFGVSGVMNGVLVGVPWALDAVLLVLIMPRLKSSRAVVNALLVLSILAVVSFGFAAAGEGGVVPKALALLVGIPAISLCIACFWTIPVRYFTGGHAAVAIGGISTIGNIGGVATLNLMPALAQHMGSPAAALWVPSLGMVVIGIWALMLIRNGGEVKRAAA